MPRWIGLTIVYAVLMGTGYCLPLLAQAAAEAPVKTVESVPADAVSGVGFITQPTTAGGLRVGSLLVHTNDQTRCTRYVQVFEKHRNILLRWYYVLRIHRVATPCTGLDLSIGSMIRVRGSRQKDGSLMATSIASGHAWKDEPKNLFWAYLARNCGFDDCFSGGLRNGKLRGVGLLEENPEIVKPSEGDTGQRDIARFWLNGVPMETSGTTKMGFAAYGSGNYPFWETLHAISPGTWTLGPATVPVTPPAKDKLRPNTYVIYRGRQTADGRLVASKLSLLPATLTKGETRYRAKFAATITEPNYAAQTPGSIQYPYGKPIQIIPEQKIQEYVRRVAAAVMPAYEKSLAPSDPTKIHFRIYVVRPFENLERDRFVQMDGRIPKAPLLRKTRRHFWWRIWIFNPFGIPTDHVRVDRVVAMPDGVILIPTTALARLGNEAQLGFVLSAAMQSILQGQAYLARRLVNFDLEGGGMPGATLVSYLEMQQTLRTSIRQMFLAGYDIREAPFAWYAERGKVVKNPVIDARTPASVQAGNPALPPGPGSAGHPVPRPHPHYAQEMFPASDGSVPWYTEYSFETIRRYYGDVDYSKLKRGEQAYAQFKEELRRADPEAFVAAQTAKPITGKTGDGFQARASQARSSHKTR